jgi:MoxR-like ATPase
VKALASPVLIHRMSLRPEAQMRGETIDEIIEEVMARLRVPGTTSRLAT